MNYTMIPQLPAVDLQRARVWYKEKLGLDPVTAAGEPSADDEESGELLYDTGTAMFGVYESPNAGGNLATAARMVTDEFDSVHARLLARIPIGTGAMDDDKPTEITTEPMVTRRL